MLVVVGDRANVAAGASRDSAAGHARNLRASGQSPQACIVPSAYRSSLMPEDILQLKLAQLQRGWITQCRTKTTE
jgi:hypothetical protein